MAFETYFRFVLALILVVGLIMLLAWFLRRFGFGGTLRPNSQRRLDVVETTPIGPRHRLLLVRRDRTEHLLLLGPNGDTVVEQGISRPQFERELASRGASQSGPETKTARQDPPPLREGTAADIVRRRREEGST